MFPTQKFLRKARFQGRGNLHFWSLGVCHYETHHPNAICQLTLPSPTPPLASSKKPERTQRPASLTNKKGRNVGNNGADRFQFLLNVNQGGGPASSPAWILLLPQPPISMNHKILTNQLMLSLTEGYLSLCPSCFLLSWLSALCSLPLLPSNKESLGQKKKKERKKSQEDRCRWITSVILATRDAEIRTEVQSQAWQTVC
jgi:hypothetical protein